MRWSLVALPWLAACDRWGAGCDWCGYPADEFFPFDGERTWEFVNDDPTVPYHVIATLDPDFVERDGGVVRVYTVHYTVACVAEDPSCVDGEPFRIRAIRMSSDPSRGTLLHSVDLGDGFEDFGPPVKLTDGVVMPGDVAWARESNGLIWLTTLEEAWDCDIPYTDEWRGCISLSVDDDANAGTPPTAHPLHGQWVAMPGFNVVRFQWRDDPQPWRLLTPTWGPLEER